jgi:hypothetical protein
MLSDWLLIATIVIGSILVGLCIVSWLLGNKGGEK